MNQTLLFDFSVNKETKTINVKREFAAGTGPVWEAWTNPEILDQWWAPKPYKAETRKMDFRKGGYWLYAMTCPGSTEFKDQLSRMDYEEIEPKKRFSGFTAFCDETGKVTPGSARSLWSNVFTENNGHTTVAISLKFDKLEDLETMVKMGFKEGFTMALENLDQYLETGV